MADKILFAELKSLFPVFSQYELLQEIVGSMLGIADVLHGVAQHLAEAGRRLRRAGDDRGGNGQCAADWCDGHPPRPISRAAWYASSAALTTRRFIW